MKPPPNANRPRAPLTAGSRTGGGRRTVRPSTDPDTARGAGENKNGTLSRRTVITSAALAIVTVCVFARALSGDFLNFDDPYYVSKNEEVTNGLSLDGTVWALTTFAQANWHPLTWLSLQADATIWGNKPFGFHLTNILLHGVNAALLFLALRALTGAFWRSAATALLFAVHPLRVESVAWIAERKDVLSVLFGLAALWAYASYLQNSSRRRYRVVLALYALSLMCKPTLVTLPCLLVVLDWWPGKRVHDRRALFNVTIEKLPFFGLTAISALVTYLAQVDGGAMKLSYVSLGTRLGNAVVAYGTYLYQTFWPERLAIFYPHPAFAEASLDLVLVAGSLLLLAALSTGAFLLRKQAPYLLTGWLWYLGTLVPMIGLVQVGAQAYADRYTYFPQIGILIALCWSCADLAAGRSRLLAAATVAAALVLVALTWNQLGFWRDSVTVWEHTRQITAPNALVFYNLGEALHTARRLDEAADHFHKTLELDPNNSESYFYLGAIFQVKGQLDDAARAYEQCCQIQPDAWEAHSRLADIYGAKQLLDEATRQYEIVLELNPKRVQAYNRLALIERRRNHPELAEKYYRKLLNIDPKFVEAHNGLGSLLIDLGKIDEGIAEFGQAIALDPHAGQAHNNLALALERTGHFNDALRHFEEAARVAPDIGMIWFNLGRARVRQQRPQDAAECFARAVALEPDTPPFRAVLLQTLNNLVTSGDRASAIKITHQLGEHLASAGRADLAKQLAVVRERFEHGETFAPDGGSP